MLIFYNLVIHLLTVVAKVLTVVNPTINNWFKLQKDTWEQLNNFAQYNNKDTIWIHCASIGEYDQIIPLTKKIKARQPSSVIAVTFFSPSGVEFHKNNPEIDFIGLAPIDKRSEIKKWVKTLNPKLLIVVKNEWWPNMLNVDIPKYHVCVNSVPKIPKSLIQSNGIHITNKELANDFISITNNILISNDTKIERALSVMSEQKTLKEFNSYSNVIMYGSFWEEDAIRLKRFINEDFKYTHIIFPHKIDKLNITNITKHIPPRDNVIIVSKMGILKYAYKYADHIYIGGGFGKGVHNTIEALVYGKPIAIGPEIGANKELYDLLNKKFIKKVVNYSEFETFLKGFKPQKLKAYLETNADSSETTYNFIFDDNRRIKQI